MTENWPLIATFAAAYLLGSVPFGLILTKLAGLGDIRSVGSGNIGATNVLRTGHKGLAALTLILDVAKGVAAVWLGQRFGALHGVAILASLIAGFAVVIGHIFPVWLKFKGGKGVASTFGVILALTPPAAAVVGAVWIFTLLIFRYSSLAAIAGAAIAPLFAFGYAGQSVGLLTTLLALIVIARHHANIRRLFNGTEPKVGK